MPLFVQGSSLQTVDVSDETTVGDLKDILGPSEGISSEDQLLTYGGIPLEDESLVCEVVPEMGTVTLTTRIRGGKVHGSLARAGKVKGQTPKVDPQEKKKKKTGRAKRRMQYNRRFVNVVQSFGRKRGPNSNAP